MLLLICASHYAIVIIGTVLSNLCLRLRYVYCVGNSSILVFGFLVLFWVLISDQTEFGGLVVYVLFVQVNK